MKNIEAEKIELKELLSRDYFYRVPEYQRPYSWDEDQFNDLIQDLLDAKKDQEYFLGTIVVHKRKDGINDIVDGQQRLTTTMILLACLRDLISNENFKNSIQEKIIQKENVVDGIPERVRIEVKDREVFNNLVVPTNGTSIDKDKLRERQSDPEWRYLTAIRVFRDKLGNLSQESLTTFTQFFSQNCIMIFLSTDTFDDAFKLFTIVNDRGKQLRRIDILKANNLSPSVIKSEAVRKSLAQKWEEWEKILGSEPFENLLFLVRLILVGEKPTGDLLAEFEEKVFNKAIVQKGERFVDVVCEYADLYNELFEDYNFFESNVHKNKLIGLVYIMNNEFPSNEWKAALMLYAKRFGATNFDKFLSLLEMKYLEGWINGQTKDARIVVFANLIKAINASKNSKEVIELSILKVDTKPLSKEIQSDIYYKGYCKYLLSRLELMSSEHDVEKKIKAKSIEHVLPQNPSSTSQWCKDFSLTDRETWTDKIANLVLLSKSKNSAARNFDFLDKKKKYLETRVSDYPRSIEVLRYSAWTPAVMKTRQDTLTEEAVKYFF